MYTERSKRKEQTNKGGFDFSGEVILIKVNRMIGAFRASRDNIHDYISQDVRTVELFEKNHQFKIDTQLLFIPLTTCKTFLW